MGAGALLASPHNIFQWPSRHEKEEKEHWSIHDLRDTVRTNFSALNEMHIAETMLGHKLSKSLQIYDHHDYLREQAKAYGCRKT